MSGYVEAGYVVVLGSLLTYSTTLIRVSAVFGADSVERDRQRKPLAHLLTTTRPDRE